MLGFYNGTGKKTKEYILCDFFLSVINSLQNVV